jgi:PPM family protein phosphatase
MALTVVEQAGLSDVGRQREANEDSYVVSTPLFAVADGMGGAQAGEVASRTAAKVFAERDGPDGTPEQRLTSMTREANRRIHDLSQSDETRRGMGTTLTAAMVSAEGVSLAHVGDSRAYRLREGKLEQLTDDHSLVAELERSGQLTREAAEHHPQRSIITRALGPEADVEVDSHTHKALPGDVYLLCSDGLTGMVSDEEMEAIVRGADTLAEAAETLIRAANQSGGKDNITVVLFRLGESDGDEPALEENTLSGSETIHQGLTAGDVQAAVEEQERAGASPDATSPRVRPKAAAPTSAPPRSAPRRRGRGRRAVALLVAVLVVAAIGFGAVIGARQVYFVGTDDAGLVTLYRGLPYDLPLGVSLYSDRYESSVPARTIGRARRERVLDHEWRSKSDAEDLVRQLERGTLDLGAGGR